MTRQFVRVLVINAFSVGVTDYCTFFLQDVPSIARKLGESVFSKCGVNLKPCLKQAVKFSGLSVDGYSKIVTTICNRSNGEVEHDDDNVSEEQVVCIQCNINCFLIYIYCNGWYTLF